ncbi:MAG: tetratricopeptide repeat protein [Verrucomicrobia bacterium]|nr:tetratricopeptide repeat protein [Verrucomicrobiota bacterium]
MNVGYYKETRLRLRARWHCAFFILILGIPATATLQAAYTDKEFNEMLEYAEGLTMLGMPDYSDKVLGRLGNDPRVYALRIKALCQTGRWAEIDAIINAQPNPDGDGAWVMKLAKADGLYAHGQYKDAKALYTAFFARYSGNVPESVKKFYLESAYKFSQMLLLLGDLKGAVSAYESALKGKPEREVERQMKSDLAEILMRLAEESKDEERTSYLKRADKIADDLLWVQDLWFAKAIVYKAHAMILNGDIDGAMDLFDFYKPDLIAIDKSLSEMSEQQGADLSKFSPLAQCRYLLGKVLHDQAKKKLKEGERDKAIAMLMGGTNAKGAKTLGAMQHLVNVFIRYSSTSWAADAGKRVEDIRRTLTDDLSIEVSFGVTPAQWAKVQQAQLGNARMLVNQQQYEEAADVYVTIVTLFPEDVNTPTALAGLAECYMEANDDLYARMTLGHLASRYGLNKKLSGPAGDALLRIANLYGDRGKLDVRQEIYERFFDNFPGHPRTPMLLLSYGDKRFAEGQFDSALNYYNRVVAAGGGTPVYYNAVLKLASCYEKLDRKVDQIKTLTLFVDETAKEDRPGHRLIKGQYRIASAYRGLGSKYLGAAINRYKDIETRLSGAGAAAYSNNKEEQGANQSILEGAKFYKAYCYSKYVPEGKSPLPYKQAALKAYLELAESHPESAFAPGALLQAGILWTVFEKPDDAQKVFAQLKKLYPNSDEAGNVDYRLAMSLLEIGMRPRAIKVFKDMFAGTGTYRADEILKAASELIKEKEFEIALEGFERVLNDLGKSESPLLEPTLLGKGEALLELGKRTEAVQALEAIFAKNPKPGRTVKVAGLLSRTYAELASETPDSKARFDLFNQSVKNMNLVRKYMKTNEGRAISDVGVGNIYELKAAAEVKYGTPEEANSYTGDAIGIYTLMIETGDNNDAKVRPYIEVAFFRCIDLLIKDEYWADARDNAERYLELFQNGKYKVDIRKWRTIANSKASGQESGATDAPPEVEDAMAPSEEDGPVEPGTPDDAG